MQDLKVIGVENGALLAASEDGDRFRIPIDEVLQSRLRQTQIEHTPKTKLSPRDVQAHIRSGMSAEDVAAVTGAPIDFVRRFEGPVVAEREYIVSCALGVPVHTAIEPDPGEGSATFGGVIRERLASLGATDERWASWKEPGAGWIVKLAFTADDIDHDARWSFEPKKNALSPSATRPSHSPSRASSRARSSPASARSARRRAPPTCPASTAAHSRSRSRCRTSS
ncbi:septation protein SepH [Cryobacterium sp. 10C3]|uniref:septation protein SepH n=1 Tax=Cryobacterium sp. 10C3 TaxID=3048577 RepID=UPI002AB53595|nr:septation protein SepH [Cryobacterium sp. 10C3]MDY7556274.1 septation protein SepH [Cryobacterium sp. 10C3]